MEGAGQAVRTMELLTRAGRFRELRDLALHTSPVMFLQSRGERIRVWIRARLPACCRERDSWSAYIFPPQSR